MKILVHFWQVLRYEFFQNFEHMGLKQLADFAFMRFVMPLGWGASDRWQRTSKLPYLEPLTEDGILMLGHLDQTRITAIKTLLDTVVASKKNDKFYSVETFAQELIELGRQREILHFSTGDIHCPLAELARSDSFIELACTFLGLSKEEIVIEAMADLLLPIADRSKTYDALQFHRDLDAYRFLKIFIYLEDCQEGEGHHEYLARSHRNFPIRVCSIRGYETKEILTSIPCAHTVRVTGSAGLTFAENTLGFHRATQPSKRYRLMATLIYTESRFRHLYPCHFAAQSDN